jgi:tripartite-type tricarboxylate transporter receptor subunit TctC
MDSEAHNGRLKEQSMKLVQLIRAVSAMLFAALSCAVAQAQDFPSRPVKIIVAFSAGGGTDIVARLLGQKLTEMWGQQVIVENRAGASGTIGTELAARAAPDGYTLFMGTLGNLSVNKHLYPKMSVDPLRDFAPITKVVDVHFVLVVHPSVPARSVNELIALAQSKPGQITYGSSGPGGAPHLAAELFKRMAGIDMQHIPYKASAQSFQDLLGGQVMVTFDSQIQALPYIRDGKLRALGVLGSTRSAQLPDVPTIGETLAGYELTNWFGLVAPAATPKDVLARIAADVARALENAELREKITALSATVVGDRPEQFGATMRADSEKWARVIREANIKAD